jgi:hypothetical protein
MNERALKVNFADPRNGWLGLEISTPQVEFREVVSYTPNDFPLALTRALSLAMQGMDATAFASCEPTTYELSFCPSPQVGGMQFQIVKYPDWKRNRAKGVSIFLMKASIADVVIPFWNALTDLQERMSAEDYLDAYRLEFPTACLERLTQMASRLE